MTRTTKAIATWACACATVLGCGGNGSGSGDGQPTMCTESVVAAEKNDYSFTSSISFNPVNVAQMSNLRFDWSGLTRDFEHHELSPTQDLRMAIVMFWDLPLAKFESELNADALFTSDLIVSPPLSLLLPAGGTSAALYDFTINTTPVTPDMINPYFDATLYPPSSASFLVGVQSGTVLGRDLRMMQAFNLDPTATSSVVPITNDSMSLSYTADLHDLTPTTVPAGTPRMTLDWSQMNTNGLGREFDHGYVTDAIVGHYAETPAELEAKFLDLDQIALATYRAPIKSGFVLDFTTLKDDSGAAFPGIDSNGTWLVGLLCGNCRNPAPWYMTILKPCST